MDFFIKITDISFIYFIILIMKNLYDFYKVYLFPFLSYASLSISLSSNNSLRPFSLNQFHIFSFHLFHNSQMILRLNHLSILLHNYMGVFGLYKKLQSNANTTTQIKPTIPNAIFHLSYFQRKPS